MLAEDTDGSFVLLARLIRTQGRRGELIADILTDFPDRFQDRTHVWLLPPHAQSNPREADIERHWPHKGRMVLKFAGIDSISDATTLSGWRVAIPREQRAPLAEDAIYISDLLGCHIIDEAAGSADLGPILDLQRGEGNGLDLLVLEHGGDELLIPFAKAYLVAVDLDARKLRMRLPEGLTTLNAPLSDDERAAQHASDQQDREEN